MTSLPPGSWIGVLGSGQLGRMMAFAAKRMGYKVAVYSPDKESPLGSLADKTWVGSYENESELSKFGISVEVITYEFENVPEKTATLLASLVPVRPGPQVLSVAQNRQREKTFLERSGVPVTRFHAVNQSSDIADAIAKVGFPGVLKTSESGYDGKGQWKVHSEEELKTSFQKASVPCVYEAWVEFRKEVSAIVARGLDGAKCIWDISENTHTGHILDCTQVPAGLSAEEERLVQEIAFSIADKLDVVGVICIEFFVGTEVLANEIAPRPHNSGHWTIEGSVTSQFEQQVRAICGLPLGSTKRLAAGVGMANLLGDVWQAGEPRWEKALADGDLHLHLYGKSEPRLGRKMGHLTVFADSSLQAAIRVKQARENLSSAKP